MARLKNNPFLHAVFLLVIVLYGNKGFGQQTKVQFKKHVLTTDFISEGAAVADVNKDGKLDVLAGTYWFEAPGWKQHELAEPEKYAITTYSNSFLNFVLDVNNDGWQDLVRISWPGEQSDWYENPKNGKGFWKKHYLYKSVGNESPGLFDIDEDGRLDLLCNNSKDKRNVWLSAPKSKSDTGWVEHIISSDTLQGTHRYTHGLGMADMNRDGRKDVVTREGWWEAPVDRKQPGWKFHKEKISEECSQMFAMDLDGDNDQDIISASAHKYGIWWHEQVKDASGNSTWQTHDIHKEFSQTHGLTVTDVNRDGNPDIITGKRYYAHNGNDPGDKDAAVIYWFEYRPGKQPAWVPHMIDDNSGVGLQVVTPDMNKDKLLDIVISNKKGVYYFEQLKP
jgi:hypothetical protein